MGKTSGGGGGGGKGKSTGGGGGGQTIQVQSRDVGGGTVTANVPINPLTTELARGGSIQNTRVNIVDNPNFKFGQEVPLKGFSVDRRGISNETNRALRQETLKVKVHQNGGRNRVPFKDETGTTFYLEF